MGNKFVDITDEEKDFHENILSITSKDFDMYAEACTLYLNGLIVSKKKTLKFIEKNYKELIQDWLNHNNIIHTEFRSDIYYEIYQIFLLHKEIYEAGPSADLEAQIADKYFDLKNPTLKETKITEEENNFKGVNFKSEKNKKIPDAYIWTTIILFLVCFASFTAGGVFGFIGLILVIPATLMLSKVIFGKDRLE
tara:strand:- start:57 stop:638 length:582 start_codon:yes stop_codon:yes gene_type:complete